MSGADLLLREALITNVPYPQYLAEYIRASDDFVSGIRRGLSDRRRGRVKPWSSIKESLCIQD